MNAIIRHLTSGEHFLATLDDAGDAVMLSISLPVNEARDKETGEVNWFHFEGADMERWDDESERWTADKFVIVHEFE